MTHASAPFPLSSRALRRAALSLAALGALLPPGQAQDRPAAAKPALTVTVAQPARTQLAERLSANGNIAPWQEAGAAAEVNGLRLREVRADVGDQVRRDQLLAVFDTDTVQADLASAKAAQAEAEATLTEARANADRARALAPSGALSAQQIAQFTTAEATAQARLDGARAAVLQQELRLRHTEVRSPDDGVVTARNATVGTVPAQGSELFRLIRQGRLEWRAEVTAAELARVRPGMAVQLQGAGATTVEGKVRVVSPSVDPQTRIALVYVDLIRNTAAGALRAGMFARGEIVLGNSGALTVPQQAVVARDGFHYVFKLQSGNRVAQQKVSIGRRLGEQLEITQGLQPQDTVAVAGAGFLSDGDTVRIAQ